MKREEIRKRIEEHIRECGSEKICCIVIDVFRDFYSPSLTRPLEGYDIIYCQKCRKIIHFPDKNLIGKKIDEVTIPLKYILGIFEEEE